jgi:predicted phage terminase large subunit-like protein
MKFPAYQSKTKRGANLKEKLDRLKFIDERSLYEGSLFEFVKAAWSSIDSSEFKSCWAVEAFCDHLECVTMGKVPRLLANYPPRASKTTLASICWPAWTWARSEISLLSGPQVNFLCASYNSALALTNSNTMRRLLLSPWYQKYWGDRFILREDQNSKSNFANSKGGVRISTSVGGSLLGLGGQVVVVDDPQNTETEKVIETDADRRKVASWFKEVRSTRLNDPMKSAIVVVMQRLHQEDLSGVILDSDEEEWTHLMIPMEFEEARKCTTIVLPQYVYDGEPEPWTDPRTKEGELMWPERFGRREVERMKGIMGPFMAAGRLQQAPVPKGGGILMRDWWQLWDQREAQRYGLEWNGALKEFPPFDLVVGSLDTSYGEKQENDFNAMTVWGIWVDRNRNRRAMLMFAWNKRLKLNGKVIAQMPNEAKVNYMARQKEEWGLIEWVADTCKRYKVQRMLVEDKTRGRDVANEINRLYARENWGVELVNPVKDKVSRAHSVVPLFTDGVVWAPNTTWSEGTHGVITQSAQFPKGAHDDLVDTVTMFLIWARENGILERADEMSAALEDEMRPKRYDRGVAEAYGV